MEALFSEKIRKIFESYVQYACTWAKNIFETCFNFGVIFLVCGPGAWKLGVRTIPPSHQAPRAPYCAVLRIVVTKGGGIPNKREKTSDRAFENNNLLFTDILMETVQYFHSVCIPYI